MLRKTGMKDALDAPPQDYGGNQFRSSSPEYDEWGAAIAPRSPTPTFYEESEEADL